MKKIVLLTAILLSGKCFAQADSSKWLRAFPITDYITKLSDSVCLVQINMPDGAILKEKQLGILRGRYMDSPTDTVQKGYGRCQLIKGEYYYFSIGNNTTGVPAKEGDLLYTLVNKTPVHYDRVVKLAAHFIGLVDVYDKPLYDQYEVFYRWTPNEEKVLIDSLVSDIKFTGKYFKENSPAMDQLITKGDFKDKKVLDVMMECKPANVKDFLDYIIVRPRLYAGRQWKISEIFATWAVEGSPTIVKN